MNETSEKSEMKAYERYRAMLSGRDFDRLPAIEWAPWWHLTLQNWEAQGLPKFRDATDVQRYFGLDLMKQVYFSVFKRSAPKPPSHGAGIIKTEAEYEKILPHLYPEPRLEAQYVAWLKNLRHQQGAILWFTVDGFFWFPRSLFGIEAHFYSFYDQPELYHRICRDHLAWITRVFDYADDLGVFDSMSFAEDMSYNGGPMLSHDMFYQFLAPYYRQAFGDLKRREMFSFVDSDGDITQAVQWYGSVGAQGMFPLERQAGVDVSRYLSDRPDMYFLGHFDKMVMDKGEAAMRAEFERLAPSVKSRRLLVSVDHQTPPAVSIQQYRMYVKLLKQYIKLI